MFRFSIFRNSRYYTTFINFWKTFFFNRLVYCFCKFRTSVSVKGTRVFNSSLLSLRLFIFSIFMNTIFINNLSLLVQLFIRWLSFFLFSISIWSKMNDFGILLFTLFRVYRLIKYLVGFPPSSIHLDFGLIYRPFNLFFLMLSSSYCLSVSVFRGFSVKFCCSFL